MPQAHLLLDLFRNLIDAVRVLDLLQDLLIGRLESLPQNIHDGPIQSLKTSSHSNSVQTGRKVVPHQQVNLLKRLKIEEDNPLHSHLRAQHIEEHIQTFVLVELCEFATDFVVDGEV